MEKTSIIILAYKEPEKFKRMFETLLRNTDKKVTPFEIIVIDNNSDKEIKEYLDKQRDNIDYLAISPKNIGVTKGYNLGVAYSKGHYLCFFNSDYYMMKDWLESMITCFEHQKDIGLISCCTNMTANRDERLACEIVDLDKLEFKVEDFYDDYKETDYPLAQMFTTKEIFNEVNGFDEQYFVSVLDLDFGESIKRKGYKRFVNRKCFGYHDYDKSKWEDLSNIDQKNREYFKNKWGMK